MDQVILDDKTYINSKRAASEFGYTQDYVGQLCRSGQVDSKRVSGQWYVLPESISNYKTKAEAYKPEPPKYQPDPNVEAALKENGREFVSAALAAKITQYNQDYVGQLARAGKIPSKQIGNRWYVDRDAIVEHKKEKDALLRAVQAESVGLKRAEIKPAVIEERKPVPVQTSPLLRYEKQSIALFPVLEQKPEQIRVETPVVSDAGEQMEASKIQIRVMQNTGSKKVNAFEARKKDVSYEPTNNNKVAIPRISIYRAVVLAAAIIVSLSSLAGIFALGGSRIVSVISSNLNNQAAAGAASTELTQLDRLLTKELVYIRSH